MRSSGGGGGDVDGIASSLSTSHFTFTHALAVGLQEFLSQEQIAEYQGVFELFDKEKRGTLDFDALKAGMLAMSTNHESRFQFEQMGS